MSSKSRESRVQLQFDYGLIKLSTSYLIGPVHCVMFQCSKVSMSGMVDKEKLNSLSFCLGMQFLTFFS